MASVQVSFPPDLEGMLRSEIWNYKTDPPHNGAGFSFCSPLSTNFLYTISNSAHKLPPKKLRQKSELALDIRTKFYYT